MTAHLLTAAHGTEMAPTRSSAAVAGATPPGAAGLLSASTSSLATAPTSSAFAFFRNCNYFLLYHFTTYMSYYECIARRLCVRSRTAEGATLVMPAARRARKIRSNNYAKNALKLC